MASEFGVSPGTVRRIWRARGLEPRVVESFTPSSGPAFKERLTDVVGMYLDPPYEKAVVLRMDGKSVAQALRRTRPSLPMTTGRAGPVTHNHRLRGTTPFAALNVLAGLVIGQGLPRHQPGEFLTFLRAVDREVPQGLVAHLILDEDATDRLPGGCDWLDGTLGSTCTLLPPRRRG